MNLRVSWPENNALAILFVVFLGLLPTISFGAEDYTLTTDIELQAYQGTKVYVLANPSAWLADIPLEVKQNDWLGYFGNSSQALLMPTVEDFEDGGPEGEMVTATSFTAGGTSFNATGGLAVVFFPSVPVFTQYMENATTGSAGAFVISTVNTSFSVNSIDVWTATDGGNNYDPEPITYRGTPADGVSLPIDVTITNSGGSNSGYGTVSFTGTALENAQLSSLEFILGGSANYVGLDNFNFTPASTLGTSFSINNVSITEGDAGTSNLDFTVTRTTNNENVAVTVQTNDGTATGGGDFTATGPTTLNFTAGGAISQAFSVPIIGDTWVEGTETFTVTLSNPTNGAMISSGVATGTINDDDGGCEDFEDNTNGQTAFAEDGLSFNATGGLSVASSAGFTRFMENSSVSTNAGSFNLVGTDPVFILESVDVWISDADLNEPDPGTVTLVGTLAGGGTISAAYAIPVPVGSDAAFLYYRINVSGTALANQKLTALAFQLSAGRPYLAVDNFKFIPVPANVPVV
ncbi:MAG: Calx-beta domain-containing protein, partial [Bacteroidota bacterium]